MNTKKPLSIAIGTLAAVSFSLAAVAGHSDNPFEVEDLNESTLLAAAGDPKDRDKDEGKCGEGKCGEGKCGEGNCGEDDDDDDDEGKCGEGTCGVA